MQFSGNPGSLGRGRQRCLLVTFVLKALRPFGQPVDLPTQRPHDGTGEEGGEVHSGQEHQRLEVGPDRIPVHRCRDDTDLKDQQRDNDPRPPGHGGNRVQSDQERGISQGRGARHQLHDRHRRDDEEHPKWCPPPKKERRGESGVEPDVGVEWGRPGKANRSKRGKGPRRRRYRPSGRSAHPSSSRTPKPARLHPSAGRRRGAPG